MQIKSTKLFPVVILMTLLVLLVVGCGKRGSRFSNIAPTITITSYEGYDPNNPYTDSTAVTLFQQRIFWNGVDKDGVIAGYAFRILDENGNAISTAGNAFIDSLGEVSPQSVLDKYGKGWVLHYKQGASAEFPLSDARAKRTIWTNQKYAMVNFLASTATGQPETTISRFEVISVDNRGLVCEQLAFRVFKSYSETPVCFLSTTKGDPNGNQVGTGIRLSFTLDDTDPFIQPTAWYYKFKVQKVNDTTGQVISEMPSSGWISTIDQPKINQYLLTKLTYPSISSDYNDAGEKVTYTRVLAKVIDLAGIESVADTIKFAVKEGFHPSTIMHLKRIYALGNNHFIDYTDTATPEVWPYTIVNNQAIYATPFFKDLDGYYTAVNSSNLKSWIRWGWHGEYGIINANGTFTVTDDPYDKKIDLLLDESTNKNYYSEITHFDIRLNDEPYNYPPLANSIHTDSGTGKKWLRVPINSSLGQTIVLTNLAVNTPEKPYHFFEVRAVDLQGVADPTPAEYKFKIVRAVNKAEKSGILVIDDDVHHPSLAPEDSIDARYVNMLADYTGEVVYRKRTDSPIADIKNRKIAFSDIQRYKMVIYHSDYVTSTPFMPIDHDAYNLYLNQGGNMLISAGGNLNGVVQALQLATQRTMETYFGIKYQANASGNVTGSMITNTWFVKAKAAQAGLSDISLAYDVNVNNPLPEPIMANNQVLVPDPNEKNFVSLVNTRLGLGPVTYFSAYESSADVKPIYRYESKGVSSQYYCPPTQADYNNVNNLVIGLKKVTTKNNCYIVGFPLSLMKKADARLFMRNIVNEVMSN